MLDDSFFINDEKSSQSNSLKLKPSIKKRKRGGRGSSSKHCAEVNGQW
jgi:hypothetical protein